MIGQSANIFDFKLPIPVVRVESNTASKRPQIVTATAKKAVNIPICDVSENEQYHVPGREDYKIPDHFIRHVKKLSDESDRVNDYFCDAIDLEWVADASSRHPNSDMTPDTFEDVINILERASASTRDFLSQTAAAAILTSNGRFSTSFISTVFPELYQYWLRKREKWNKPLCRRYWPPVPATDPNPYQVFRMRDRERYRLRRHRRNDVDAFRKLQQFYRELEQAKVLAKLMIERENLSQVEFSTDREIFAKEAEAEGFVIPDLSILGRAHKPAKADLQYEPLYRQLWIPAPSATGDLDNDLSDELPSSEGFISISKGRKSAELRNGRSSRASMQSSDDGLGTIDTVDMVDKKPAEKKKRKSEKLMIYGVSSGGALEVIDAQSSAATGGRASLAQRNAKRFQDIGPNDPHFLGYSQPSILEPYPNLLSLGLDHSESKLIHENVSGPRYVCRPVWPAFYEPSRLGRGQTPLYDATDYLDALEDFRYDSDEDVVRPVKYRLRCRIGRGNRLVIDKIPVYGEDLVYDEEEEDCPDELIQHYYPTMSIPSYASFEAQREPVVVAKPLATAVGPTAGGTSQVTGRVEGTFVPPKASAVGAPGKPLPDLPNSNRRLLYQARKHQKLQASPFVWCSSTVPALHYQPATAPSGPVVPAPDRNERIKAILNEPDSEDEEILIGRSVGAEIRDYALTVQKNAEILIGGAHHQSTGSSSRKQHQPKTKFTLKI